MGPHSFTAAVLLLAIIAAAENPPDQSSFAMPRAPFEPNFKPEYDFCILGGGTAGSVLANRLTESGKHTVVMFEAGLDPADLQQTYKYPGLNQYYLNGVSVLTDFNYVTPPQPGWVNKTQEVHRGMGKGGSTITNGMYARLGSKPAYDSWEKDYENPGWNFETIARMFKKSTSFTGNNKNTNDPRLMTHDPDLYGNGPIQMGWQGFVQSNNVAYMKALDRVGIPVVKDLNSGVVVGVRQGNMPVTPDFRRITAYEGYVKPIEKKRKNLTVLDRAYVLRILFDKKTEGTEALTATGVTWHSARSGVYHNTSCKYEVISSLGSINTPQMLMVSGIGPRDNLESVGVRVLIDMPKLATEMVDHDSLSAVYELKDEYGEKGSTQDLFNQGVMQSEQRKFFDSGKPWESKMSATSGCTNGFGRYPEAKLRRIGAGEAISKYPKMAHVEHLYEGQAYPGSCSPYFQSAPNKSYISFTVSNMIPTSLGTITLSSKDMASAPIINPHYFETKSDTALAIQGLKDIREVAKDPELAKQIAREVGPGPAVQSDADLLLYARRCAQPNWHWTSTCPMKPKDKGGIVDPKLHVYGTKHLRLCDASIYPLMPDTNLMMTTYAVAEYCAELIRKDYQDL